jgi:hypothetical protein
MAILVDFNPIYNLLLSVSITKTHLSFDDFLITITFMLIFNTTFLVADRVHGTWLKWVREEHIPFMLASDMFTKPQIAKVLSVEEQDGTSYSVQFHIADIVALENWHIEYAKVFEQNFAHKFGTEVIFFASVLELIQ